MTPVKKSDATRRRVLDAALRLFRDRGFDATTMRDVARAARLSLGAAYYYFPSKEAMVMAYYAESQAAHRERARAAFATAADLRGRLGAAFHTKLDLLAGDRELLGAIFRSVGAAGHPLSVFAPETRAIREESIAVFAEALEAPGAPPLPEDLARLLPVALWAAHLGMLLHFLHDPSPGQARTRRLVDGVLDLLAPLVPLAASPLAAPARARLAALVAEAMAPERSKS